MTRSFSSGCMRPSDRLGQDRSAKKWGEVRVRLLVLLLSWGALGDSGRLKGAEAVFEVTVHAGPTGRQDSIVSFECPDKIHRPELSLAGHPIPIQLGLDRQLYFVVPELAKGAHQTYRLRNGRDAAFSSSGVWARQVGDTIRFERAGSPIVQYQASPSAVPREGIDPVFRRGGYLHPVWSPAGRAVTDDYPENHLHHHGIWVSWTKTEFDGRQPNFWEMGHQRGTVEFVALDHVWSGSVFGGFRSRHRFVDLTWSEPVTVLNEQWEVKVFAIEGSGREYHVFDLTFVQACATDKPIRFPQYRYGGLGVRGRGEWDGRENAHFLTGLGETDRIKGHATRAPWCHLGGKIGGHLSGIAILCHPDNFRAPQPMRIHPSEPFFCYAPAQAGDWEIQPGEPYVSRYRFLVFDGAPDGGWIDRLWEDYASPMKVEIRLTD